MRSFNIGLKDGRNILVPEGTILNDIIKKNNLVSDFPVVLGKINNKFYELGSTITHGGDFELVDITSRIGTMAYVRTLQFVLIKAISELFPEAKISIEHSLSKGLFGEIHKTLALDIDDIYDIKSRMSEIIKADIPIRKIAFSKERAVEIFTQYDMQDKVKLLKYVTGKEIKLYELDGRYDYFYGPMAYSTGILKIFDLMYYEPGFILRYPTNDEPDRIPKFYKHEKLAKVFYEAAQWGEILSVGSVGALNNEVVNGDIVNLIRVAEALHEKKIAYIADMIYKREKVKLVLIAGPSSSGKTTFSKRLGIQLRVNGLIPIFISLDDYFINREITPRDESGEYDFESIYALDLELINKDLKLLLEGKETEVPSFNFKTGKREWHGNKIKMPENGVMIVEGIHGLNEILTSSISKDSKFKIYISPLTQLNLDDHNRISTTDVRMTRRIVRDYLSRGYGVEDTLKMWPSIKRGEEKNIFVFQEQADAMFNSSVVYELCVLKKFALAELNKVGEESPVYYEASRLRSFLNFFKDVDKDLVPDNSIIREFTGGSCFYKY
ncbi:nucleoside kinase [Clostridium sp. CF011]|uniref:nucleoside kinase n=1 Tax=unclassified Clostridium TaxID=2614128 RepID=UPI001C0CF2A5|nr:MULTISPECIES: nucleoside kinase [unclassified Clostridium]MBU3090790.1 nucleoside kinase [Clostridium sp. CF011]MBW9144645.1 nucleoside kinase [Clostridium sp. CM027]UVE40600.1 nucleoside kinase [Clostridium sp. CM027]WAG69566.1 nucleoside kinase [Clostridium sp. CF011]